MKEGGKKVTKYAWPGVIHQFIEHWATRPDARDYANDDIVYTRELDKHSAIPTQTIMIPFWRAWWPSSAGKASRSTSRACKNCWRRLRRLSPPLR